MLVWCVISFAGAAVGLRFAPRYFMQLLPAMLIPAARGFWQSSRLLKAAIAAAL